jgi:aldose sugar dehydrogenase
MKSKITYTFIFIFFSITILISTNCGVQNKNFSSKSTEKTYMALCSDCHGKDITSFEKIKWTHGITKEEIYSSIANGYEDVGMPSYKNSLRKKKISKLTLAFVNALETKNNVILADKPTSPTFTNQSITITVDTIAKGLDKPWGFTLLAPNTYLISDRNGKLYKVQNKEKTEIKNIPKVQAEGQGGLLDIALHPQYKTNGWIYFSYSKPKEIDSVKHSTTAIIRAKINDTALYQIEEIFEAKPYVTTKHHYGCRMVFDNMGYLFFGVGERGKHFEYPQKTNNDLGKIHRIHDDGKIPTDNPFVDSANASKSIYTYGNRNPQGITKHPVTGQIWENEHGPKGGDEVNIIQPGLNYGWPVISYGINYNGTKLTKIRAKEGMAQPYYYWVPSIAPSAICFVTGNYYPAWKGDILASSLKFKYLERLIIKDNKVVGTEKLLKNVGRMRNVVMGDDGYIYITIEDPGTVLKLLPQ